MKSFLSLFIFAGTFTCLFSFSSCKSQVETNFIHIDSLCVHDPCILADPVSKNYYMYGNYTPSAAWHYKHFPGKNAGIQVYESKDLEHWSMPELVFESTKTFWATESSGPWAPEVHYYKGKYYLFTTFNKWDSIMDVRPGRGEITLRASQILVSDTPKGPFMPFENKQTTPDGEMTLDATFYEEKGTPYIVYCHEWVQTGIGTIKAAPLSSGLEKVTGPSFEILSAGEVNWDKDSTNYHGILYSGSVTDGPYFYKMENGTLAMIWSSWHKTRKYALSAVYSESGSIKGPWKHTEEPLLLDDRGHGMIFRDFNGHLLLCLHRYFHTPATRVQIWEIEESGNKLRIKKQLLGAG